MKRLKNNNGKVIYSLRKSSFGLVSVAIAAFLSTLSVNAEEVVSTNNETNNPNLTGEIDNSFSNNTMDTVEIIEEPIVDTVDTPVTESVSDTDSIKEPVAEPVVDPVTTPVTDSDIPPVVDSVVEPVKDAVSAPVITTNEDSVDSTASNAVNEPSLANSEKQIATNTVLTEEKPIEPTEVKTTTQNPNNAESNIDASLGTLAEKTNEKPLVRRARSLTAQPAVQGTTLDELKAAIANNQDFDLIADLIVTEELIPSATYTGIISSSTKSSLLLAPTVANMFNSANGASLTFKNITLNGQNNGRLIKMFGGKLIIEDSTITNGTSALDDRDSGGAIFTLDTAIQITNSTISNNRSVYNPLIGAEDMVSNGGAIYVERGNELIVTGSQFLNNVSGTENANGGAMFIAQNKNVRFTNNTFTGNHTGATIPAGYQGGSLFVEDSNYYGSGNVFNVANTFNTGGAIKFIKINGDKSVLLENETFNMANLGDSYGISGGAIVIENSDVTIRNSKFEVSGNSKLTFAGGMIDLVGAGNFTVNQSTFTGRGAGNGLATATYGGAITFETGSNYRALIADSTFTNVSADQTGGAISLSTKVGETSSNHLTLRDSFITNTATLMWSATDHVGGAIYVGPGNSLEIDNTLITNGQSGRGGSIFNQGSTTITGGSTVTGGIGFYSGGGIYNDGYLKLDDMTLDANFVGPAHWSGNPNPEKATEYGGVNIYAAKDVIITPLAKLTTDDVRVLDKQSAIILTGSLTAPIHVSISEVPATFEKAERYIGYTVAKGDGTYTPTADDAHLIHYKTKETANIAPIADRTSIGTWDYVLDDKNGTVVVGQRAKLIYHANGDQAHFGNGVITQDQLYTIHSSVAPWMTPDQLTPTANNPVRPGYKFVNWYDRAVTDAEVAADREADRFAFDTVAFTRSTNPITTIVDPNEINVYAGWVKVDDLHYFFESGTVGKVLPQGVQGQKPSSLIGIENVEATPFPNPQLFTNVRDGLGSWSFQTWADRIIKEQDGTYSLTGT